MTHQSPALTARLNLPEINLPSKLSTARQMVVDCDATLAEIRHPLLNACDTEAGTKAVVSDECRLYLQLLTTRLNNEIGALKGVCSSIGGQTSTWPDRPEDLIKDRAEALTWHGFDADLVGTTLDRASAVTELLNVVLAAEAQTLTAGTLYDAVCSVDGHVSTVGHLIDDAIGIYAQQSPQQQ